MRSKIVFLISLSFLVAILCVPFSWAAAPSKVGFFDSLKVATKSKWGEQVAQDGYAVNGFASRPGLQWALMGARDSEGRTIYTPQIGEVSDVVIGGGKSVIGIVASVGGFLGMGESYVTLDPSSVALADDNGTWKAYVDTSKEDLSKAPKLDYSKFKK